MDYSPSGRPMGRRGLIALAESFAGQEDAGALAGLLLRLARYLQGDPSAPLNVTVPFGATTQLPDNTPAQSAVFTVTVSPIFYRMDGGNPGAVDSPVPVGAVVTLTGQPSLKGFRATSGAIASAVLTGSFYD